MKTRFASLAIVGILFTCAFFGFAPESNNAPTNQTLTLLSDVNKTSDTLTNTGTVTLRRAFKGGTADCFGFQIAVQKVSGTIAGNIILQGSYDGTNWYAVSSTIDTVATTNTSGTKYYELKATGEVMPYSFIGVSMTGTNGTQVAYLSGQVIGKTSN